MLKSRDPYSYTKEKSYRSSLWGITLWYTGDRKDTRTDTRRATYCGIMVALNSVLNVVQENMRIYVEVFNVNELDL